MFDQTLLCITTIMFRDEYKKLANEIYLKKKHLNETNDMNKDEIKKL